MVTVFGIFAGLLVWSSYREILQEHTRPAGLVIHPIGPTIRRPLGTALISAFTVVPGFFITGVVAVTLALIVALWAACCSSSGRFTGEFADVCGL